MLDQHSDWLLWLRQEFSGRPALQVFAGLVVGLTIVSYPINLVFLVLQFCLAKAARSKFLVGIGFLAGALLASPPHFSFPGVMRPVEGRFMVIGSYGSALKVSGQGGTFWLTARPQSQASLESLELGSEIQLSGLADQRGRLVSFRGWNEADSGLPGLRHRLVSLWREHLSSDEVRTLSAFTLGMSDMLDPATRAAIQKTGSYSLISTSGLQVFGLIVFANLILGLVPIPRLVKLFLTAAILFLYLGATGWHPGTWRAAGISLLVWFAPFVRREFDALSAVSFVSILYLIFRPAAIFEPGFQFSVIAVAGGSFFPGPIGLRRSFWGSGWMWLILMPLTAQVIGVLSFVSIVTSPALVFVAPVINVNVYLGSSLFLISPQIGVFWLHLAANLANLFLLILVFLGNLPFSSIIVPPFSAYILVVYYLLILRLWRPRTHQGVRG